MLGEVVHYVGIPKPDHIYDVFHTEFIVNLQGEDNPDLTYKQFKHIMNEMRSLRSVDAIYEVVNQPLHYNTFDSFDGNKLVHHWVKRRCCWAETQYEIDKIYSGNIDAYYPHGKYIFITLRQFLYITLPPDEKIRLLIPRPTKDIIAKEMPTHPRMPGTLPSSISDSEFYTTLVEGTPEFEDKYIAVRKYRGW